MFLAVALILGLVMFLIMGKDRFKADTGDAIENIRNGAIFISLAGFNPAEYQVVELGETGTERKFENSLLIQFSKLADENTINQIKLSGKKTVLYSAVSGMAARAWVILNQSGVSDLFILKDVENPEKLKYEFHPDTTAKLDQSE